MCINSNENIYYNNNNNENSYSGIFSILQNEKQIIKLCMQKHSTYLHKFKHET